MPKQDEKTDSSQARVEVQMVGTCPAADKKAEQVPVSEEEGENSGAGVASAEADGAAELRGQTAAHLEGRRTARNIR